MLQAWGSTTQSLKLPLVHPTARLLSSTPGHLHLPSSDRNCTVSMFELKLPVLPPSQLFLWSSLPQGRATTSKAQPETRGHPSLLPTPILHLIRLQSSCLLITHAESHHRSPPPCPCPGLYHLRLSCLDDVLLRTLQRNRANRMCVDKVDT